MRVHYFIYAPTTKRVGGIGAIAGELWQRHQGQIPYKMVPIWDLEQLHWLRENGPQNFMVKDDFVLELLPPEQRNLRPIVLDNRDDDFASLNAKMDVLIDLMRPIAEALKKL
jgi:hypothetical protein